ncbi:hypothetical protein TorRG33x02_222960 [Trema orientale]|uniref:Secreted protein n=1 Tax=Trema orientale TaxID=63057 RepID=A0A2P5E8K5_TREOI|nr:hypothetical protein TorRG33x02_222960 [Trema orientale]
MSNSSSYRSSAITISNWLFLLLASHQALTGSILASLRVVLPWDTRSRICLVFEIWGEAKINVVEHDRDRSGCVMGR